MTKSAVLEALQGVANASGNGRLVESGHLKNVQIFGQEVELDVVSDSAALAQKKRLEVDLLKAVHTVDPKVQVKVNLEVRTPAPAEQANVLRGKAIPGVEHVVAVASGKGGVGKSTVTANLAVSLAEMGFKVGVVDADIYGPSMPIMFDVQRANPGGIEVNGVRK
ncbi:MAG: P-loop NTPase, partial [Schleiferiaceae bacterium]